jgi:ubiquitin-like 1-activating enzyme E1 B
MPTPSKRPLKQKVATPPPDSQRLQLKRSAPDDDEIETLQPAKKIYKANGSPSKRKQLDDDGILLLEKEGETIEDDDVIVLD